jgi:hypothetical protein
VSQHEECECEERHGDDDPDSLLEGVAGPEPVDLREADRGQEAGDREQVRIGKWNGPARDEMGSEVESKEETRVGQRRRRDDVLA